MCLQHHSTSGSFNQNSWIAFSWDCGILVGYWYFNRSIRIDLFLYFHKKIAFITGHDSFLVWKPLSCSPTWMQLFVRESLLKAQSSGEVSAGPSCPQTGQLEPRNTIWSGRAFCHFKSWRHVLRKQSSQLIDHFFPPVFISGLNV